VGRWGSCGNQRIDRGGISIKGAEDEKARQDAWYGKIRPVMQDGDTVADAEKLLGITRKADR
jgi:hypothetical protein